MPAPRRGRRLLLSAAGPTMRRVLHEIAAPAFDRYARRWGYDVRVVDLPADGAAADHDAQQAKWAKPGLLRGALADHDLVVWLDADVLLVRDDEDVAAHLHPAHFQALALEQVPAEHRVNPNTGVWVMRHDLRSFRFLEAVEAAGPQPGPWADQGAVLAALGWRRGDERYHWAGPGAGTPALAGTSWLPPGWNQPYTGPREPADCFNSAPKSYEDRPTVARPFALHFMGLTPAARFRLMAEMSRTSSVA